MRDSQPMPSSLQRWWSCCALCRRALSDGGVRRFLAAYVALWGLVLLSGALSEPSPVVARIVALVFLLVLSAHAVGERHAMGTRPQVTAIVLALAGAIGAFAWPSAGLPFGAVWIASLAALYADDSKALAFARRCVLSGIISASVLSIPVLWNLVNQTATALSTVLFSWCGGGGLGASASGFTLFVIISPFLVGERQQPLLRRLVPLSIATALLFVHSMIASLVGLGPDWRFILELIYVGLLLTVCLLVCAATPAAPSRPSRLVTTLAGGIAVAVLAFFASALPGLSTGRDAADPRSVLFIEHTMLGSWRTPADAAPGEAFAGATFGLFPEYLIESGHSVVRVAEVSAETLANADLAVIINPGTLLAVEDKDLLESFVHAGGGLLILGDHTNIGGVMDSINDVTASFGLSLLFDSAVAEDPGWLRTLRVLNPLAVSFDATDVPVSIGASVGTIVHPLVAPLIVGHRAISDPGEDGNVSSAYLGNLQFDRGERYGDVVLAAVRHLGRGKIVLFGDTSPFQNSAMAHSHMFADALVRWMTNTAGSWRLLVQAVLGLLLLAVAILLVRTHDSRFSAFVALAIAVGLLAGSLAADLSKHTLVYGLRSALIDAGHSNLVHWQSLAPQGIEGLTTNLARARLLPRITSDALTDLPAPESGVVVSIAPTRAFSDREEDALLQWLDQGGRLLLTTGWPHAAALRSFLSPLGLSVAPIPLGASRPIVTALEAAPQLLSTWPLVCTPEWTTLGCVDWDWESYTVIAEREVGKGSIVVIGDAAMLSNENLEGKGFFFAENIGFLAFLLDSGRKAGDE